MRQDDIDRAIVAEMPRLRAEGERVRTQWLNSPLAAKLTDFAKLSLLRQRLGLVGAVEAVSTVAVERANMELFRNVMLQARTRVERWGGQLVFVYLPDWDRYAGNTTLQAAKRGEVIDTARGLGIPVIDIDSAFLAHGDPLSFFPFRRPGHYNAAGHRAVAEAVLKALPAVVVMGSSRGLEAAH
jgi:hypothetical protein